MNKIEFSGERKAIEKSGIFTRTRPGSWVSIRPCSPEENKTYLGIFLGYVATGIHGEEDGEVITLEFSGYNPAIYVPELDRIVFGYESFWGEIKSQEDLKEITDQDIENVWYVQAIKSLEKAK